MTMLMVNDLGRRHGTEITMHIIMVKTIHF
jgi:hypothetical protein